MDLEYSSDTDTLDIYLVKAFPCIVDIEIFSHDLSLSYDDRGKIVAVHIEKSSELLHYIQEVTPRFMFSHIYYEDSDIFELNFVDFTPPMVTFQKNGTKDI